MKALEIITNSINKSMQKDMRTLGFSRSQYDMVSEIVPHLHVAFRNGYAMNVYEEDGGKTLEVNIMRDGDIIEKENNDYAIEFLNAIFNNHTYNEKDGCAYRIGCYCNLNIRHFIVMFKYFKSIK